LTSTDTSSARGSTRNAKVQLADARPIAWWNLEVNALPPIRSSENGRATHPRPRSQMQLHVTNARGQPCLRGRRYKLRRRLRKLHSKRRKKPLQLRASRKPQSGLQRIFLR